MGSPNLKEVFPWQVKHGDVIYGQALPDINFFPIGEVVGNAHPLNTRGTSWRIFLTRTSTVKQLDIPAGKKVRIASKG